MHRRPAKAHPSPDVYPRDRCPGQTQPNIQAKWKWGYKFQFITLAGFHALNLAMFELARGYKLNGMTEYSRPHEKELCRAQQQGYEAVKHRSSVGTGYFEAVQQVIASGAA